MVLGLKGIDAPPASDGAGRFEEACEAVEVASKDLSSASMIEFYGGFLQALRLVPRSPLFNEPVTTQDKGKHH